ncbi:hypothetical protein ANCDUO_16969 [Ancylostoma duodenale]|uniref:Uncharacterized protein n=2 Tax=Ancylostoma duodenale TaxID=51022 RepID=A0A0C2FWI9_9BILA|nr:hypothetical protein ANCDUO_16969 [Ancylostoma duodenale]
MAEGNDQQLAPKAEEEVVQMRLEDFEVLLAQARAQQAPVPPAPTAPAVAPAIAVVPMAGPSSSSKPTFSKPGLARQFDFNSTVLASLSPLMEFAPEESEIKANLTKAITLLKQRNELLVVADTDPDIFEFYDQHSRAEAMQSYIGGLLAREEKEGREKTITVSHCHVEWIFE